MMFEVLFAVTLHSVRPDSALLYSVHVYARVHTSIYIYIYIYPKSYNHLPIHINFMIWDALGPGPRGHGWGRMYRNV